MYIGLHVEYRYSCQIVIKVEFPGHILEKILKISWKSVQWEPSCSVLLTDRRDEANSRFLQFLRMCLKSSHEFRESRLMYTRTVFQDVNELVPVVSLIFYRSW
jgi:hypothetical protein